MSDVRQTLDTCIATNQLTGLRDIGHKMADVALPRRTWFPPGDDSLVGKLGQVILRDVAIPYHLHGPVSRHLDLDDQVAIERQAIEARTNVGPLVVLAKRGVHQVPGGLLVGDASRFLVLAAPHHGRVRRLGTTLAGLHLPERLDGIHPFRLLDDAGIGGHHRGIAAPDAELPPGVPLRAIRGTGFTFEDDGFHDYYSPFDVRPHGRG